jgi:valyl-tRNA synthetase
LSNANFINKAPKEKIDNEKNKLSEYEAQYKMIKEKI